MQNSFESHVQEVFATNESIFRKGVPGSTLIEHYNKWAQDHKYDKDTKTDVYRGPQVAVDALCDLYPGIKQRQNIRCIDVAAGTGRVGVLMKEAGFINIDALDPVQLMLDQAMAKGCYNRTICEFFGSEGTSIGSESYDLLATAGGIGPSHMPSTCLHEMRRVVKKGGYICIVMRNEYVYMDEFREFEKIIRGYEDTHKWRVIRKQIFRNYFCMKEGLLLIMQVL